MPTPGFIVSLRINPNDVMSIIDVLDTIGVPKQNLSFAQATKIALASLLEGARQSNLVPRRDGFEYSEMIKPFAGSTYASRGAKLRTAYKLSRPPSDNGSDPRLDMRKAARLEELLFKHNHNQENMDDAELKEMATLLEETQ